MIIELSDTNASEIAAALLQARRSSGSPAMGMVLTLVVVADEDCRADAIAAAREAAKEHPSRIIGVILHRGRSEPRLDAEVQVGGDAGPGEDLLLRMYGSLTRHPASAVTPLLLPESPVVTWWAGKAPRNPAADPLGALADRRVTDASTATRPLATLLGQAENYVRGDTDLAWTRTTPWRALLAATLDQPTPKILGATVEAEGANATAELLVAWLSRRLRIVVERKRSSGPGITAAHLHTADGDISITRPDGRVATYVVPDQPDRMVALSRRQTFELLAEELRWLDPDEMYEETVRELHSQRTSQQQSSRGKQTRQRGKSTAKASR